MMPTATTIAITMTHVYEVIPTAVMTESIEKTMSSNKTWPMTAPKVGTTLAEV